MSRISYQPKQTERKSRESRPGYETTYSLKAYENCNALIIIAKGNDVRQAPSKLNQVKVCLSDSIEKLASGMSQQTREEFQSKNKSVAKNIRN